MTSDRDATRLISSWLRDTTDALPDNEAFFVRWLDELPAVEQRRPGHHLSRPFGRRTPRGLTSSHPGSAHPSTLVRPRTGRPFAAAERNRPMAAVISTVAAAVAVALFGALLLAGVLTTEPVDEPLPATSPSATASYVVSDISDVVTNLSETRRWDTTTATNDALWFSDAESVYRMDAVSGEVTEIPLETEARWLLPTESAIWVVSAFGVQRIDRATLSVPDKMAKRSRGQPLMWEWQAGEPIVVDGSIWIAAPGSESHALVEIDLETISIAGEYVAGDDWSSTSYGNASEPWMAAIGDAIWIHSAGRLTRFDLATREFTDKIDIPGNEARDCCIATEDAIWLPQTSGSLRRFDVSTHEVTDTLDLGPGLRAGVAAAGAIWIPVYAFSDQEIGATYRIDLLTMAVTDVIAVGSRYSPAFLHEAIWVEGQDTLSRIDVETREVTDVITLSTRKVLEPLASDGVIWAFTEYGGSYRIDGGAAIE